MNTFEKKILIFGKKAEHLIVLIRKIVPALNNESAKYTEKSSLCGNLINWLLSKHEFSYKSIVLLLFYFIIIIFGY